MIYGVFKLVGRLALKCASKISVGFLRGEIHLKHCWSSFSVLIQAETIWNKVSPSASNCTNNLD